VLREHVFVRARGCCEYCLINQADSWSSHEVDHIRAVKHGGRTVIGNLALACYYCNRHKGSDLGSLSDDGAFYRFFNPRRDRWDDHFEIRGARIESLTQTGEVTARILQFNAAKAVTEREGLQRQGRYPTGGARVS
jgi:hypothetical protein